MAWYPGAIRKPLTVNKGRQRLTRYNRVNLHVAVSESASLFGAFNQRGKADSHFYVRKDGTVEQYVDTAWRANADLEGNDATISVETQGGVYSPDTEPWTTEQVRALADLYVWAMRTHGIAKQMATNSHIGASSHGLSWHRLGVTGNFPSLPNIGAGRTQRGGGMKYSNAFGKLCPGLAKIRQIPTIFALATDDVGHVSKPVTPPKPVVKPPSKPAPKPVAGGIDVDGYWGHSTTRALQKLLGTPVDGTVSQQPAVHRQPGLTTGWHWVTTRSPEGSQMIYGLQDRLKKRGLYKGALDGLAGPLFWTAFQKALGTVPDGELWAKSPAIKKFQTNLNNGKLW